MSEPKPFSVSEANSNIKSRGQEEDKKFEGYQTAPEHNFIENSLVILTKYTLDVFLQQKNPSELISLYTFYYYTAKWQQTNQPKCTTSYAAKGLHWNRSKVAKVKKQLLEFGLIEDVRLVDPKTKIVRGYYIKMNYIFKQETLEKSQCTRNLSNGLENDQSQCTRNQTLENEYTNALSVNNKNALSENNIYPSSAQKPIEGDHVQNKKSDQKKNLKTKTLEKEFQSIWDTYPNKKGKAKAFVAYVKARKNSTTFEEVKLGVENYNKEIRAKSIDQQYIKHGDTWFRNSCWEDEYEIRSSSNQNTSSSYNLDDYYKNMDTFLDTEPQEVTTNPNAVLENLFRECDVDYRVEQRKKQLEQEKKQKSKDKKPNTKHNPPSNCDQKKIDEAVKKLRDERNTSSLLPEITWQKIAEDVKYLSEKNDEEEGGILAKIFPGDKEYIDTS